ncbi:MAG: hypothetical protein MZW92_80090 [Comamonadaceae bacterium]|nr:hypothetical protein [Comamonadaceae bacterium]
MSERLQAWLHMKEQELDLAPHRSSAMDPDLAEQIYELDRCIECGCCVAGLRHGAHARGLRRRGGPEPDRALPPRPARRAHRRRLLRRRSATTTACSAACRCSAATTSVPRICPSPPRSPSCAARMALQGWN